ncbi:MAG TPA: hypothetical protein VFG35_11155 [Actinoplanes sp.]|nr:hypothetical protein [Actinoplanes sp.]
MKRRDVLADGVLLAVLVAAAVLGGVCAARTVGPRPDSTYVWVIVVLQVTTSALVVVRRRSPVGTAVTIVGSALVQTFVTLAAPTPIAEALLSVSVWIPIALCVVVGNIVRRHVQPEWSVPVWMLIGLLALISVRPWDPTTSLVVNGLLHSAAAPLFALALVAVRRVLREGPAGPPSP